MDILRVDNRRFINKNGKILKQLQKNYPHIGNVYETNTVETYRFRKIASFRKMSYKAEENNITQFY